VKLLKAILWVTLAVLWIPFTIVCAVLPVVLVAWSTGEWRGDVFHLSPAHKEEFIAGVVLGNLTGIAGLFTWAWLGAKLEGEEKP